MFELNEVLRALQSHAKVVMQTRPPRFKFGTKNYGEVPGMYNSADGDPWDVFAPGYNFPLHTDRPYRCKRVIGVYKLQNGNHKIAIQLYVPGFDRRRAIREISRFCTAYSKFTRVQGTWVDMESLPLQFE